MIAIYLAIYLQQSYAVTLAQLAFALALVALGNLLGNFVGGRIADRYRSRSVIFALASAATAVLAIPLMAWQPGLEISVSLGFVYSFANALGRPAFLATLSEVPNEVRGAAFGINVTMASVGWLLAGSIGGWFVTHSSFGRLGGFSALAAMVGTALAVIYTYTGRHAKGCD